MSETANTPLEPPAGTPLASRVLVRELLWAVLCLVLGVVVMPCVIFAAGRATLGPYENGGVFALWRDFLMGLVHGSEAFWFVALAPYLLFCVLRLLRRLLHN